LAGLVDNIQRRINVIDVALTEIFADEHANFTRFRFGIFWSGLAHLLERTVLSTYE
jgi:hypothetical protein